MILRITHKSSLVNKELYFNEYELQEQQMIKYKNGNDIRGLENVLYWCPKCNSEFTMKNYSYDTMKCTNCGNEVYLDEYSFLNPKTKDDVCSLDKNLYISIVSVPFLFPFPHLGLVM